MFKKLILICLFVPTISFADCKDYPKNLENCTPSSCKFKHPFGGQLMEKKIIGLQGSKCSTTEAMPRNGKMSCQLTEQMRKAIAKYMRAIDKSKSFSTSTSTSTQKTKSTYKIDGKEVGNPLQAAMENGSCKVSGYN